MIVEELRDALTEALDVFARQAVFADHLNTIDAENKKIAAALQDILDGPHEAELRPGTEGLAAASVAITAATAAMRTGVTAADVAEKKSVAAESTAATAKADTHT